MSDWPDVEFKILTEGVVTASDDPQEPEDVINLWQQDRVAVVATTRLHGEKAIAYVVMAPGFHRPFSEQELQRMVERQLRQKLEALVGA